MYISTENKSRDQFTASRLCLLISADFKMPLKCQVLHLLNAECLYSAFHIASAKNISIQCLANLMESRHNTWTITKSAVSAAYTLKKKKFIEFTNNCKVSGCNQFMLATFK